MHVLNTDSASVSPSFGQSAPSPGGILDYQSHSDTVEPDLATVDGNKSRLDNLGLSFAVDALGESAIVILVGL